MDVSKFLTIPARQAEVQVYTGAHCGLVAYPHQIPQRLHRLWAFSSTLSNAETMQVSENIDFWLQFYDFLRIFKIINNF